MENIHNYRRSIETDYFEYHFRACLGLCEVERHESSCYKSLLLPRQKTA